MEALQGAIQSSSREECYSQASFTHFNTPAVDFSYALLHAALLQESCSQPDTLDL